MTIKIHHNCFSSKFLLLLPLISLLLFQAIIIALAATYDLETDKNALLDFAITLQKFPYGRLGWTSTEAAATDPICTSWVGVTCSRDRNRVVELRLPGFGLRGTISGNTTIGRLDALEKLDLQGNFLSGVLPPSLTFPRLRHLNLSGNRFGGSIPPSLRGFPPSSFAGNALLCGPPLTHRCRPDPDLDLIQTSFISPSSSSSSPGRRSLLTPIGVIKNTNNNPKKKLKPSQIAFIVGGACLGVLLIGCFICVNHTYHKHKPARATENGSDDDATQ